MDATPRFKNPSLPAHTRAADLVARMTLAEKVSQLKFNAPPIARLNIPAYNWWNEGLHGLARSGTATVFPQAIGLAATWNPDLIGQIGAVISSEARAQYHEAIRQGVNKQYYGLTLWSPNINIFRDPRWGRGQETYGEDPYLTSRMGVAFVRGLQGADSHYLKTAATPKHYAVHSGPEQERHRFNAQVSQKDLYETYLPAFEACVVEAQAASIMGAYNRTNDEPCCASPTLLQKILRDEWGFAGYVVSDCGAIEDIYQHHQVVETPAAAAALAVQAGCDLECGAAYPALLSAVEQGLIPSAAIDQAAVRLFTARLRLGMFDPPELVPYAEIPIEVCASPEHRALALEAARQSIVLLKNENGLLPLPENLRSIAVIGPNADDELVLLGNYHGKPASIVTPLAGLKARVSPPTGVLYQEGCDIADRSSDGFGAALAAAQKADAVIFFAGLSQLFEGEEGQTEGIRDGQRSRGDRSSLDLPGVQEELLQAVHATGKPVILVLLNGSALAVNWAQEQIPAILEAWYPGEAGGAAIAEVIFGDYNPAGRLPVTFYRSAGDLPAFDDYRMDGRTYRFFRGQPLYPFGYGLSYTTFTYSRLHLHTETLARGEYLRIEVDVENRGSRAGDEVVQIYLTDLEASTRTPLRKLAAFQRVRLKPGETHRAVFTLQPEQLAVVTDHGRSQIEPGMFLLFAGGRQPTHAETSRQQAEDLLFAVFQVKGNPPKKKMFSDSHKK